MLVGTCTSAWVCAHAYLGDISVESCVCGLLLLTFVFPGAAWVRRLYPDSLGRPGNLLPKVPTARKEAVPYLNAND